MRLFAGRRRAIFLAAAVCTLASASWAGMKPLTGGSVMQAVTSLNAGDFIWAPQLAPQGPVLVVVNIATQRLVAYRNGVPIAVSTVSTGRAGHRTPMGVFTILQKRVNHRSSTYNNAPMPYMQRLTWRGIALHGGSLPGYPASHGCIRLPHEFARLLFGETSLGMTVVVVNQPGRLRVGPTVAAVRANLPTPDRPDGAVLWRPELAPTGPVSIVVSAADRRMVVLRNGVMIGSAPVSFNGAIATSQAFTLQSIRGDEYRWVRVALPGDGGAGPASAPVESQHFDGPEMFRAALTSVVAPGTTMVVIPDSLGLGSALPTVAPALDALTVIDKNAPDDAEDIAQRLIVDGTVPDAALRPPGARGR